MGKLVDGVWHDRWYDTASTGGRFVRKPSQFRSIDCDGKPERYHLYVSLACPWAHRTLIARALKGLAAISVSVVEPLMLEHGWMFSERYPDALFGARHLYELYVRADDHYTGRVTVPVLWDKHRSILVNNESAEILRIFNSQFGDYANRDIDLYPRPLRAEIDAVNERVYDRINNGVYKAGFATAQAAYDEAVTALFTELDALEQRLSGRDWLVENQVTEADIRLFTTLFRFDSVYNVHFKCSRRRLVEYPRLWAHTRRVYALPGVAATCDTEYIKQHYYGSHETINPLRIVPKGPEPSPETSWES